MSSQTLVLLTRPLDEVPTAKRTAALAVAAEVILIENGVYERADAFPDAGIVRVVKDDADARRVETDIPPVGWDDLVDAIERHKNVITL